MILYDGKFVMLGYSAVGRAPVLCTASPRFDSEYPDSGEMQSPENSLNSLNFTATWITEGSIPSARFMQEPPFINYCKNDTFNFHLVSNPAKIQADSLHIVRCLPF